MHVLLRNYRDINDSIWIILLMAPVNLLMPPDLGTDSTLTKVD
jgi:hypothetical protein